MSRQIKDKPTSGVTLKNILKENSSLSFSVYINNKQLSYLSSPIAVFLFLIVLPTSGCSHILPYALFSRKRTQLGQRQELWQSEEFSMAAGAEQQRRVEKYGGGISQGFYRPSL